MFCQNCGEENKSSSKFCTKCGEALEKGGKSSKKSTEKKETIKKTESSIMSIQDILTLIINAILKPYEAFKNKKDEIGDIKNCGILSGIIVLFATILSLLGTMLNSVRVVNTSFWTSETNIEWHWENLGDINYIKTIGMSLLIYIGFIALVSGLYYISCLIVKKQTSFVRLASITAISLVPVIICSTILATILNLIYSPLAVAVTIIGAVYSFVMIYENINNEISLKDNIRIYVNIICIAIIMISVYFIGMNMVVNTLSKSISTIFN